MSFRFDLLVAADVVPEAEAEAEAGAGAGVGVGVALELMQEML